MTERLDACERSGTQRIRASGTFAAVPRLVLIVLVVGLGCVPKRAPAIAVEDVFVADTPLDRALTDFVARVSASRAASPVGAPMPPPHVAAWNEVLAQVEQHRAALPLATVARARLVLQTAVDDDRAVFGDLPNSLAQRLPPTFERLRAQLVAMTTPRHHANPRAFVWPASPVEVTSPWGERVHPIRGESQFHAGVDLAAELAQPIRAADVGTVSFAGWNAGHGKQVELQHDEHLSTRYSHLSTLLVSPGQRVRKGEVIALAGQSGLATGPHLHFELWRDGEALDPELLLPPPPTHAVRVEVLR